MLDIEDIDRARSRSVRQCSPFCDGHFPKLSFQKGLKIPYPIPSATGEDSLERNDAESRLMATRLGFHQTTEQLNSSPVLAEALKRNRPCEKTVHCVSTYPPVS